MESKNREDDVYWAVQAGELTIDGHGRIWRVAARRSNRWSGGTKTIPCEPRRAEHDTGTYFQVRVMRDRVRYYALAHRLVWRHFVGPIPPGMTVNHKNGNKQDNRLENLELATHSEQVLHARRVLKRGRLDQHGMRNSMVKLTPEQVQQIRERRSRGETLVSIAEDFSIVMQHVSRIARGTRRSRG